MARGGPIAFAAAVATAVYLSSLPCDFVFDDTLAIVNNADVKPDASLVEMWRHDFWGKSLEKDDSHKSYRPLTVLSFRLHTLWTREEAAPYYFHAINILLHSAATACVAAYAGRLWSPKRPDSRAALLSGLVFAVHPVHVEAVTGVVGRAELLCTLCCFAAAAAYRRCASCRRRWLALIDGLSVALLFAMGVLCKETGVTLLGILGIIELCAHLPRRAPAAPHELSGKVRVGGWVHAPAARRSAWAR